MTGFIYIGSTKIEKESNYFKIGKTKKTIKERIKQYQTGRSSLNEFLLLDYFPCNDCNKVESVLKLKLKPFQDKGEMYNLEYDILKKIIKETIEKNDYVDKECIDNLCLQFENDLKLNPDTNSIISFIEENTFLSKNGKIEKKTLWELYKKKGIDVYQRDFNKIIRKNFKFKENQNNNIYYWIGVEWKSG